ncbi:MAG: hypothetical protein IKN96_07610 [Oscillibacter sp.]|nr:hypothetical protein [Oscillibacter sp.]
MVLAERRRELRGLVKYHTDIIRRIGKSAEEIARELSKGHTPEEMYVLCGELRGVFEGAVADALFELAEEAEDSGYAYLAAREGGG